MPHTVPETIVNTNGDCYGWFIAAVEHAREVYQALIGANIPRQDARFVLPTAMTTCLVVTMSAEALRNFAIKRMTPEAQWEIRAVAKEMLRLAKRVAPKIFGDLGDETEPMPQAKIPKAVSPAEFLDVLEGEDATEGE